MQEIHGALDRLRQALEAAPEVAARERRAALEEAGQAILRAVAGRIGGSGRIAGYQEMHMGSRGDYTAVRPRAKTQIGRYAAGYVTNSIESGHVIRRPKGVTGRKSRARFAAVRGKYMYMDTARYDADRLARQVQERIVNAVEKHLKEGSQ